MDIKLIGWPWGCCAASGGTRARRCLWARVGCASFSLCFVFVLGTVNFVAIKAPSGPQDGGATRTLETEPETLTDARAIAERHEAAQKEWFLESADTGADKLYRGLNNYKDYIAKREGASTNKATASGPLRQSQHVRMTNVVDYQPDVCKDYKETGYCGYGDSCKFMHDRGDYLSGWQIENQWQAQQKALAESLHDNDIIELLR